ncbi:bifunctional diguanylate cyclase/phosphodiesterase [Roseovarius sp. LXJ103]|uniref:putative bifunctional diguanylate cyclase/phosphodiesterase n=1 Tax=Roseovarius carneus TaxID=2853164 RepID=UPI000D603634|nr:bifunctional diguanylate cyclase/phosphodiesterase [Roseovarius carneus]MBZ8118445.1 bifunctional diguanylate cyclase/phosphodiesterase [Roseovarius carneus]PWE37283.1 diguanylate cyclase [Pelagicola sp. LXJ1103]
MLAFLLALVLGGYWLGGEQMLIMGALGFPICLAFASVLTREPDTSRRDEVSLIGRDSFEEALHAAALSANRSSCRTGCVLIELDDYDKLLTRYGRAGTEHLMTSVMERLCGSVRGRDRISRLEDNLLAVSLAPMRRLDLGNALHIASRLQTTVEEPLVMDGATVYVSASVGLTLDSNVAVKSGAGLMDAASVALAEARRHGPSAMRVYSQEMHTPAVLCDIGLADEAIEALEAGQIHPWFQPQVSTDTGRISGFEALARWHHPKRGLISPLEFLPALEQSSQMGRLGEVILYHALSAMKSWDLAGLDVPQVGVNFAPEELRNPRLIKKIEWELDRFELAPSRLTIEILETVVASSPDDTVVRNIAALSKLGCQIDLDDFGTGHASISSLRRFDVQRLKIDRSFVMKVDRDPQQQRMVSAIITMAEQLGLETLAEGVETAGEHAMLGQLGCGYVQGFGIGRPMPLEDTLRWAEEYMAKIQPLPEIGRQTG